MKSKPKVTKPKVVKGKWTVPALVERVVDGDTVVMEVLVMPAHSMTGCHIRVAAINAPEMSTPEGVKAKSKAMSLLPEGTKVWLTMQGADPYGRSIAAIQLPDGSSFGDTMVQGGFAVTVHYGKLEAPFWTYADAE